MSGATYEAAGVSLAAADEVVERIRPYVARTARPEVLGDVGGFSGLFQLDPDRWRAPVLVSATDGVGTKLELARVLGRHDTIGIDLVAMVVDDLVCAGAEPLFFLDYVAVGRLDPAHVEQIVAGVASGCVQAGCALVGGETAEHPGVLAAGQYDLAGFGVGIVDRAALLGPARVRAGDALVAMASSGLHANGFSLARWIVEGRDLTAEHGLGEPLGDALLRPTRIYAPDCLALIGACDVHALCHVTGGGIAGNLVRVLPAGLGAAVDRASWEVPPVFRLLQRWGDVDDAECWRVFNQGVGMVAVVADGDGAVEALRGRGVDAWVCGEVVEGDGVRRA
ncbi:MAG: phosphoribosylformylglycinamidine cyclo-ligase [Egibacteraceae bacterium]